MKESTDYLHNRLQVLRDDYAARLPGKIAGIEALWEALVQAPENGETLDVLYRTVHSLVGTSATFGFSEVSTVARAMEYAITHLQNSKAPPTPGQCQLVADTLEKLRRAAFAITHQPVVSPVVATEPSVPPQPHTRDERLIYLIEDDPVLAGDLELQIRQFGYTIRRFAHLEALRLAVQQTSPAAIVVDITCPDSNLSEVTQALIASQEQDAPIPLMFISGRTDLQSRLQAVRAGGEAYFTRPLNISRFIDRLDALTKRQEPEPYRILIVEDEADMASYCALTLEQQGMITEIVTNPMLIMHALAEFKADLILMDLYMPGCNGLELAKVIRQQEAFVSIPIVFLSAETDLNKQMAALRQGGDDFLTKPIRQDHLIASVIARVQRSRTLQSFMVRDGLTGLFNHTKLRDHLRLEIARARRASAPLSFAMIDIDHFKGVNDTYGHTSGDRVIKSLARLLQQRLRKTDIIGRYGGEEFAVIFPKTPGAAALRVLNDIRACFAQISHHLADTHFSVTFSAGIAMCPPYIDTATLCDAADQALYASKRSGRNRVLLSGGHFMKHD